ncbi:hypothetical protein RJ55_00245 [Drechmeria coniospora]|nr:hypothetical protein RJ55_00245 [Drechmeria coniospora]
MADSDPDEAVEKKEPSKEGQRKDRNAFTELMKGASASAASGAPGAPGTRGATVSSRSVHQFKDRMGLGAYLGDPGSLPASVVIYHNDDFVAIRDKFPKATVHALILPRSSQMSMRHPFDALADEVFLGRVRREAVRLGALVASELQRRLGPDSRADEPRQAVLRGDAEPPLPPGRDWGADVRCGVHAVPSMRHLHVHVLSRDMHSPALRHRNHYNSFNTPFFVDLADFPLAEDDPRRDPQRMAYLRRDLCCWRCGRNFGNQFKRLTEHLEEEYNAWRRE